MLQNLVGIYHLLGEIPSYPQEFPYHPSTKYPEYPFSAISKHNSVYQGIRELLHLLNLDNKNFNTPVWNPLGEFISPGDRVVIKPNFVIDSRDRQEGIDPLITHPSVIRAVVDYVIIALNGRGEVIICDTPQNNCNGRKLRKELHIDSILNFFHTQLSNTEIKFFFYDLRKEEVRYKYNICWERVSLPGDPLGYILGNLHNRSEMQGINPQKLYGADYDRQEIIMAHREGNHIYNLSKTVL